MHMYMKTWIFIDEKIKQKWIIKIQIKNMNNIKIFKCFQTKKKKQKIKRKYFRIEIKFENALVGNAPNAACKSRVKLNSSERRRKQSTIGRLVFFKCPRTIDPTRASWWGRPFLRVLVLSPKEIVATDAESSRIRSRGRACTIARSSRRRWPLLAPRPKCAHLKNSIPLIVYIQGVPQRRMHKLYVTCFAAKVTHCFSLSLFNF